MKALTVVNIDGDVLRIDLDDRVKPHGLQVFSVEGLGSPTANIATSVNTGFDGEVVNSAYTGRRSITITVITDRGRDQEVRRALVYKYFSREMTLEFDIGSKILSIAGTLESIELNTFSEQENFVISVICPYPWFSDASVAIIPIGTSTAEFVYPVINNSLTQPTLSFGIETELVMTTQHYTGDVPNGMNIVLDIAGPTGDITIYNEDISQFMTIKDSEITNILGYPIMAGDQIILETSPGKKELKMYRGGVKYNVINALPLGSDWLVLKPGENKIVVECENRYNVSGFISYKRLYRGI